MRKDNVKPDWRYIAIDETGHWCDPEVVDACERIFGVYIFDARTYVYCCEITPSYELYFLRNEALQLPEDEATRERIEDVLLCNGGSDADVCYRHVRSINVEKCKPVGYEAEEDDTREARDQVDDVLSYACEAYAEVPLPA